MRPVVALVAAALASCSGPAAWKAGTAVGDAPATPLSEFAKAKPDSIVVLEGTVARVCQTRG
jgi:hypothetical protein